jgi:hypothetical protein
VCLGAAGKNVVELISGRVAWQLGERNFDTDHFLTLSAVSRKGKLA